MDIVTHFIAQLFGLTFFVVSIAMLYRHKEMLKLLDEFLKDRALLFLAALISLMSGLFIVLIHNDWSGDLLTILVTIAGWALTIRGLVWLFVPSGVLRRLVRSAKKENVYFTIAVVILILGIYLIYAGFWG